MEKFGVRSKAYRKISDFGQLRKKSGNFPTQAPSQASEKGCRAKLEKFELRSQAYVKISGFRQLCEKVATFQHRPQAKPERKAAKPNWKSLGSGPKPMRKSLIFDSSVKKWQLSNTGPKPVLRKRLQGQIGKDWGQVQSLCENF